MTLLTLSWVSKESVAAELNAIMDAVVELKMDESAGELPSDPGSGSRVASPEPSKESIAAELDTIIDDNEAKNTISVGQATSNVELVKELQHCCPKEEPADEVHSETGSLSYVPPTELRKESIAAESSTMMKDGKAEDTISMDQATCVVKQLVDEWKRRCPKDESAEEVHSEPGSLLCVPPADLSKENIVAELKAIMDDSKNIISMGKATYGWQLVEELQRRGSEDEPSGRTASFDETTSSVKIVLDADKVEGATSNGQVTNTLHLVEELHQLNDETGFSDKICELNAKPISEHDEIESITSNGQATHLVQLAENTVLKIPSAEVNETLMDAEMNTSSKDAEVENIILNNQSTNGLQLVGDLHQPRNETNSSDEICVAYMKPVLNNDEIENTGQATKEPHLVGDLCPRGDEAEVSRSSMLVVDTELQVGTVNGSKELMVVEEAEIAEELHKQMVDSEAQKHEKTNLKLTLDKKRTEIAEALESLKAQMDQKLKKIDEIAKQEAVIDTEIAHLESQCSECKGRHDKFIDLFKLVVESQLPLRSHREVVLLMNKEDKAAQKVLSKALELRTQIDAQAKLKLTLQEERSQFAKLVEALKVQKDQKLKEADEVNKLEEAADSEITPSNVPQHTLVYTRSCRKRKTRNRQLAEEELCSPDVQAKRTTLSLQQTDP